jgi:predicted PurR-regulated permease PerM
MARRHLYYVLGCFLLVIFASFLYLIRGIFSPFIFAIIIAYILNPPLEILERWGFSRLGALTILYFALFGFFFIIATELMPLIIKEMQNITEELPKYTAQIQDLYRGFNREYSRVEIPQCFRQGFDDLLVQGESYLANLFSTFLEGTLGAFSYLPQLLLAPVLAFYLLKDLQHIKEKLVVNTPVRFRREILDLLGELDAVLSQFIRGHIYVCLIVGFLSGIGTFLIGIDFAVLIGFVAGVTNIIPYFGPIIGAVPAIFLASLKSPLTVIYVIVVFTIVQQLDSCVFTPLIIGEKVGLSPLTIIVVLLMGVELFGFFGLLLAVPLAGVIKALFRWFWRNFGDRFGKIVKE